MSGIRPKHRILRSKLKAGLDTELPCGLDLPSTLYQPQMSRASGGRLFVFPVQINTGLLQGIRTFSAPLVRNGSEDFCPEVVVDLPFTSGLMPVMVARIVVGHGSTEHLRVVPRKI